MVAEMPLRAQLLNLLVSLPSGSYSDALKLQVKVRKISVVIEAWKVEHNQEIKEGVLVKKKSACDQCKNRDV